MSLGKNLKELRLKRGWTQEELSKKLGVSNKMISFYELGTREPSRKTLIRLTEIFGISVEDLISEEGPIRNDELTRDIKKILIKLGIFEEDTQLTQDEYEKWLDFIRSQAETFRKFSK